MRLLPILLLLCAAAAAAERESVTVRLKPVPSAESLPRVTFPQARFSLTTKRPKGAPDLGEGARYALARLGSRLMPLAFDAPDGAAVLGRLHGDDKTPVMGRARQSGKETFFVDFRDARCGGLRCNVRLAYKGLLPTGGVVEPARHRRGRVRIAGVKREVILVDADGDGRFSGAQDRWITLRADRTAQIKTLRQHEALLLTEPQAPFLPDGRAFMVADVRPDGSSLTLILDTPKMSVDVVLRRRYAEVRTKYFGQFLRERAEFVTRAGLDAERPRAKKPVKWTAGTLDDAKARALREHKPILVFFITESNPWCFRYEFYTFPDHEVDALLRRFVCVRIDVEKNREGSYLKSGARGLPTLMPLDQNGKPVEFRVRHRDIEGNVADLERLEKHMTGWQRPPEFVENLRRILAAMGVR